MDHPPAAGRPLACITCGPSYEPIDRARRITNFATGEIGLHLASALTAHGFDVVCFRGEGSTFPAPAGVDVRPFSTNASLSEGLRALGTMPDVIFHAAALCDFIVAGIEGAEATRKISSRDGEVRLLLKPAQKILPLLRGWFPGALIVGWKYELDGSRDDAIARAAHQIREGQTDACVVNGAAFGEGFGLLLPDGTLLPSPDKPTLAELLASRAEPGRITR